MREYWLSPPEHDNPICPVCGNECETIYTDRFSGEEVGCDFCLVPNDSIEYIEEKELNEESSYGDYLFEKEREERNYND